MTGWVAVVNPRAGRRGVDPEVVRRAFSEADLDVEMAVTSNAADVDEVVLRAIAGGRRHFIAVGGDGTLNGVADAVLRHPWHERPVVATLSLGSGSDFSRTFGLPRRVDHAVARIANGEDYRIDVGRIRGDWGDRFFLNVCDVGVAAATIPVANRLPRQLGSVRYPMGFWLTLPRFKTGPVTVTAGDREYSGPAINVVVANGQFFGGGMNVAPKATLIDGKFDVQVFIGPRRKAFEVMPRVVRGLHLRHSSVRRFEAATVRISPPPDWPVEADGELLGRGAVTVDVVPAALDVRI